jgi:transcriptional regulator with XRE-family HTH domain
MDLKSARLHNRLTQTELADAAGITQATIATLEKGIHPPRVSVARQIEQALGQRIDFPGYPQAQEYKNADTLITLLSTRPRQVFTWIRELPGRTRSEFFRKAATTLIRSDPRNLETMLMTLYQEALQ